MTTSPEFAFRFPARRPTAIGTTQPTGTDLDELYSESRSSTGHTEVEEGLAETKIGDVELGGSDLR